MARNEPQRAWKIYAEPAVEPVTLTEAKLHLKLDAGTLEESITVGQSIAPGSHGIAAGYSLKGTGVDVSGAGDVVAVLDVGQVGSPAGTVDVKLQESDTGLEADYTDVADGAFAQVTGANDNQGFKLAYGGNCTYVRAVATVAGAACPFGVQIVQQEPESDEDSTILRYIKTARRVAEKYHGFAYCTQTWELYMDRFPVGDFIELPRPPLQTVTHVKYKEAAAGVLTTWPATEYLVDTFNEPGRIVLKYGYAWPNTYPEAQAVQIRYVAGYGLAAAVPAEIKDAILRAVTDLYNNRGDMDTEKIARAALRGLLGADRIVRI